MSINTIITTLLTQLSKISPPPAASSENDNLNLQHQHQHQQTHNRNNIFTNLSPTDTTQLKNLLLTMHCLFPNELLLALDILDRGLVMRYTYQDNHTNNNIDNDTERDDTLIFIVRSTSTSNHDRDASGAAGGKVYHVHLKTWNCSCPAFVLSCFPPSSSATSNNGDDVDYDMLEPQSEETGEAWFGGTLRNRQASYDDRAVPVCKHILACVLVAKCPNLFGGRCLTYEVNDADTDRTHEVAGWCAA